MLPFPQALVLPTSKLSEECADRMERGGHAIAADSCAMLLRELSARHDCENRDNCIAAAEILERGNHADCWRKALRTFKGEDLMNHEKNGWKTTILTVDGDYFDFVRPDPRVITINAIARGLANTCRFAGQLSCYYSVAEHSVYVSQIVPPELAIQGLLHDAAEAFIGDMPKPLKVMLDDYQAVEERVEHVLFGKWGFTALEPAVKHADKVMLKTEQYQLLRNKHAWKYTEGVEPVDIDIQCLLPDQAYELFLNRAEELGVF